MMLGMKWEAWDQELHGTGGFVGGHADVDWLTGDTRDTVCISLHCFTRKETGEAKFIYLMAKFMKKKFF